LSELLFEIAVEPHPVRTGALSTSRLYESAVVNESIELFGVVVAVLLMCAGVNLKLNKIAERKLRQIAGTIRLNRLTVSNLCRGDLSGAVLGGRLFVGWVCQKSDGSLLEIVWVDLAAFGVPCGECDAVKVFGGGFEQWRSDKLFDGTG
jgi:hypothetical protein